MNEIPEVVTYLATATARARIRDGEAPTAAIATAAKTFKVPAEVVRRYVEKAAAGAELARMIEAERETS